MNVCKRIFADQGQINNCREVLDEKGNLFSHLSILLSLTGNEVRLKILFLLDREGKLCPCDLSDILDMTIPAISQHLRKLKDGGMIHSVKSGQTIFYSIEDSQLDLLRPFFNQLQKHLTTIQP
ncbi:ArsR/SmtB family transcription factor [Pedobacter nototheniae]|uniref:ArsR/SmtB family transcription factor n=1 Tax=Pedobacter nototheniae TaxID=2488994 RepID=UPI00103E3A32|nr:metalloregulator ArsR/SmtB family transcription factor [Pedobacter nototheniae]